jgi:hypothetical protein
MVDKKFLLVFTFFLWVSCSFGNPVLLNDSTHVVRNTIKPEKGEAGLSGVRYFNQVIVPENFLQSDPVVIPEQIFTDSTEHYRLKAQQYHDEVIRRNAFAGDLSELISLQLPAGIRSKNGDLNYTIIISRITIRQPYGAFVEAYLMFELPQTGDKIAFRGKDIKFTYDGGFTGDGKLELIGNYPIKINDKTLLTLLGKGNTFVEFGCGGFKGMGVEAEVEFSRDFIIPEDEKGKQKPSPARVKTKFGLYAQDWNDLLIGVTIPSFQVNGLKDFSFSVQEAYMDWSDLVNPPGLMFPPGYTSTFLEQGQPQLWRGFYLKRTDMKFPASFAKREGKGRLTVGMEHVMLDDLGFTGRVFHENILEAGDMNGWAYTIDNFGLEIVTNSIKGFDISGRISVPNIRKKEGDQSIHFGYLAQRGSDGNYTFAVTVDKEDLRLPFLVADLHLLPGSAIMVKENNGKFYPSALLNGELSISGIKKGIKPSLMNIRFEGMRISTEAPKFDIQTLSFGSDKAGSKASGYPVVINNILVKREDSGKKFGIGFDLTINIGDKPENEGFGGTASLIVWSKNEPKSIKNAEGAVERMDDDWAYHSVEITGVGIKIKRPGVIELEGMIRFFDEDAIYGDGFSGKISGKFGKLGVTMEAVALFGKTPVFRYWFADAMVSIPNGVPITPGLSAFGFGGGFYSKMKQATEAVSSTLGQNKSGITYVPDENTIGIKAIMMIGTPRPEAFKGDVALEIILNRHGGINSVTFTGKGELMSGPMGAIEAKLKSMAPAAISGKALDRLMAFAKGQIYASMVMKFDNVNDVFHGDMEFYVNVAAGLVRGIGPGNKAGWATIHFSREEWYILVGTPDQPVGLEVARIFKSRSYFMLGKNLPGSPPPPQQVSEILGNIDLDYMRDMNQLESGMGFAFGLHFGVDTGDLRFLMFYGRFSAGTGVDFMLKDYGENCQCAGQSGPVGINGWFANGQAYAFVQGKIGVKVKLKFIKGEFDILSIGAAAVLQAKGPNPFWMKGIVGGYYSILGGMVKGNCKFEVELGKECKIIPSQTQQENNPLENVTIIADLSPVNGEKEVDVFVAPQAAFNMPIGEVFDVADESEVRRLFRGKLQSFKVMDGSTELVGELRWNETKDVVAFDAFEVLPSKKELKISVRVSFEEYYNGQWKTMQFEGKPLEESKEISFTSGLAPEYIPASNIDISYPAVGQFNFYSKEYPQGFIALKKSQAYLFKPGEEWVQKIHLTDAVSGAYLETTLSYNESEKRVYFTIPTGLLNTKAYQLAILNFPKHRTLVDANVKNVETNVGSAEGEMTVSTKKIEGSIELKDVKTVYTSLFRTSKFNTFKEKITTIKLSSTFRETVMDGNSYQLFAYMYGSELFDKAEISVPFKDRELQFEAVLDDNDWYRRYVYPLVYEGYPLLGNMAIRYRNEMEFGFPPVKSLYVDQPRYAPEITEEDMSTVFTPVSVFNSVIYDVNSPMYLDYLDIQNQVANYVIDHQPKNISTRFATLLSTPFPGYRYGKYKFKINYVIPRVNKTTSSHEWELFNTIKD